MTAELAWSSRTKYLGKRKKAENERPKQNCTHSMSTKGFVSSTSDSADAELGLGGSSAKLGLGLGGLELGGMGGLSGPPHQALGADSSSTLRLTRGGCGTTKLAQPRAPSPQIAFAS